MSTSENKPIVDVAFEVAKLQSILKEQELQLDDIINQLNATTLKPQHVTTTVANAWRIKDAHINTFAQLGARGYPVSRESRTAPINRMNATIAKAEQLLSSPLTSSISPVDTQGVAQTKLPQIELSTFSGDLDEWVAWNRAFVSIIGSVHPSESGTIAAFRGEKGKSQLDEKGNVFTTFNLFQHA